MNFLRRPNISKMAAENDRDGLYNCLNHQDPIIRLQSAQALAEMGDGVGWRFLTDTVRQESDPGAQETAAAILGELGARSPADARRAVKPLAEVLKIARGDLADAVRDALEMIGGQDALETLRREGYAPVPNREDEPVTDFDAHYIRPVLPGTDQIEFLSAEQHLNNAIDLREAELAERGLVECNLALWLQPEWAYAWYLRGVLLEDLERPFEAWLAYRRAGDLDPALSDAREALEELDNEYAYEQPEQNLLLESLGSGSWRERRDAAAGLGTLAHADSGLVVEPLLGLLDNEEREVRQAAIQALGKIGVPNVVSSLVALEETSWLLRFTVIEALSNLACVDGLMTVLRNEMNRIQERNPVFSSLRDPLLEVEYDRLMEIGVLALERTGRVNELLTIAENNAWEEIESRDDQYPLEEYAEPGANPIIEWMEDEQDYSEADEDLDSYVDEAAWMAIMALERCAKAQLEQLPDHILHRTAVVPDLTLIDLSEDEIDAAEPAVVHDLGSLRDAAQAELARRGVRPISPNSRQSEAD